MTADDVLRYKKYIETKRHEISENHNLLLTHFLIVSSSFKGDFGKKIDEIGSDGIVVSLMPASELTYFSNMLQELEFPKLRLVELRRGFCHGLVSKQKLVSCV